MAKQSVEQFTAQKDLAKNFYEVGLVPRNDYLQAEVRLADGTQSLVRSENRLEEAKARFNTALRRPISTPVAVVDALGYKPFGKDFDQCLQAAMDNRPEIQVFALKAEQRGKRSRS